MLPAMFTYRQGPPASKSLHRRESTLAPFPCRATSQALRFPVPIRKRSTRKHEAPLDLTERNFEHPRASVTTQRPSIRYPCSLRASKAGRSNTLRVITYLTNQGIFVQLRGQSTAGMSDTF